MKAMNDNLFRVILFSLILVLTATSNSFSQTSLKELKKNLALQVDQNQAASAKVKRFIKSKLIPQISNPALVKAVKEQNAKKISLDEIKKLDTEWIEAEEELPIHNQVMSGDCANQVNSLVKRLTAVGETFVMDNQGANVCQNSLTSDYWQGDEAKWKNSYNKGVGGVDVGVEKLDRSTNMVLQQVSLPIADNRGKVIGAVCYGVMTGRL